MQLDHRLSYGTVKAAFLAPNRVGSIRRLVQHEEASLPLVCKPSSMKLRFHDDSVRVGNGGQDSEITIQLAGNRGCQYFNHPTTIDVAVERNFTALGKAVRETL